MTPKRPLKVSLNLARPRDLLERWYPNGRLGGLTLDGALPGALGRPCEVVVRFREPQPRHFNVLGQLAWARHKGSRNLRECFGIDFVPEDEPGRTRLLLFANEQLGADRSRFSERLLTDLPVKITHEGRIRREVLADMSPAGAFVRSAGPLPVGAVIELHVRVPRSLGRVHLTGRVVWIRETGSTPGMGIEFLFDDRDQAQSLRKLLARVSARPR